MADEAVRGETTPTTASAQYQKLAARFRVTHKRPGSTFDYLSGFQVIERLNQVLGYDGWDFRVVEHGVDQEADEVWVLGRMTVWSPSGREIVREQFGSQQHNRSRTSGKILDTGFDLKGAATDCLKKCASLFGVGLYLSAKGDETGPQVAAQAEETVSGPRPTPQRAPARQAAAPKAPPATTPPAETAPAAPIICGTCLRDIEPVTMGSGRKLTAAEFAAHSIAKVGQAYCAEHFKAKYAEQQGTTQITHYDAAAEAAARAQGTAAAGAAQGRGTVSAAPNDLAARLAQRYGPKVASCLGRGYREPDEAAKRTFYIRCANHSYKREDVYRLLGMDPDSQHLQEWLRLADTTTTHLQNLVAMHAQDPELHVPTYDELAGGLGR